MYYYAYIDERNICVEIYPSETEINEASFILIESEDYSIIGKYWNGTTFVNAPFNITADHSTDDICYKSQDLSLSGKLDTMDSAINGKSPNNHVHTVQDIGAAPSVHTHPENAAVGHNHDGTYAAFIHDHHDTYSQVGHGHTPASIGAAPTVHAHSVDDFTETAEKKVMTSAEREKLASVAEGANNYTHPASHPAAFITGLATVATSGSYNDLADKPTVPGALADLTADATHRTVTDAEKAAWNGKSDFSGNYADLTGKPTIPAALADLEADSTHRVVTDAEKNAWNAKSNFSGDYNDLENKPTIPSAYTHPSTHNASMIEGLAEVATSGDYNDLENKPVIPAAYSHPASHPASIITGLSEVATSGDYADLTNKPTIPAAYSLPTASATTKGGVKIGAGLSVDENGVLSATGGGTADSVSWDNVTGKPSNFTPSSHNHNASEVSGLATVATSGSYNDLSNKPSIPAAYVHPDTHSASMITGLAEVATSGDYNDLENKPTIPEAYTHPTHTAKTQGLYKVTIDDKGHVIDTRAVTKADLVLLGLPSTNTTYNNASSTEAGLMTPNDFTKLAGIETGANKTTVDVALSADSTNPVQNKVVQAALEGKAPVSHSHTDNVFVEKASSPTMRLTLADTSSETRIYKNASATADYGTTISDYNSEGARDNLIICKNNALENKVYLNVQNADDTRSVYYLYGEHHKPTPSEIGALPATGGDVSGNLNVNGILRVNSQQAIYDGGTMITLSTNNRQTMIAGSAIYSKVQIAVSSDERLKENIEAADTGKMVDFINGIDVKTFNYIGNDAECIGVIAQQLQAIDPAFAKYFVSENAEGFLGVKTSDLVFPLIAAVQRLTKEVEDLKKLIP